MTIRKVLQVTYSTSLILCVLNCSPILIGATNAVAPIRVGPQLSTQKIRDVLQVTCSTFLIVIELPNKLCSTERNRFMQITRWGPVKMKKEHPAPHH